MREELIKQINEFVAGKESGIFIGHGVTEELIRVIHFLVKTAYFRGRSEMLEEWVYSMTNQVTKAFQAEPESERSEVPYDAFGEYPPVKK